MNEPAGSFLSPAIKQATAEAASVQSGCNVHTLFRPSYTNTATGRHGIRHLIVEILADNPAGLTTAEIMAEGWRRYTAEKYPETTYIQNLSNVMHEVEPVAVRRNGGRGRPRNVWRLTAEETAKLADR